MQKWAYRTMKIEVKGFTRRTVDIGELDALLNEQGQDGWELMSCLTTDQNGFTSEVVAVFKRPAE